jgi:secondary thiamine-phosphate synthase enzyme
MWYQTEIKLNARPRGFHLITADILQHLPGLKRVPIGMLHVFIKHTSASLTINENADPTVREDFERFFNHAVPEGSDDMPSHLKSSLLGASLMIPVTNGRLNLGIWQGIYLCEHRNHGGSRTLVLTLQGQDE